MVRPFPLALVVLASVTCTRPATPQSSGRRARDPASAPSGRDAGARATPVVTDTFPRAWSTVRPGIQWRHTTLDDEAHVLDWIVVRFDLEAATPCAEHAPDDRLAGLSADPTVLFAIDAGFFTEDLQPAGALVSRGVALGAFEPRNGGSGLLSIRRGRAEVIESTTATIATPGADLAVQCGPRLIERDGTVGIRRDDGRRYARTAACIRDAGRTLDFIVTYWRDDPMHGPGLLEFAQRLAAASPVGDPAGCEAALNLDGGPSTGVYVRGVADASHDAIGPVPFALTVRERSR